MKLRLNKALRAAVLACGAAALSCGMAQAAYVWKTGDDGSAPAITTESWNNHANWELTDGTTWPAAATGKGPGVTGSDAWNQIVINNGASGTVADLEGWCLRLSVLKGTLTVDNVRKMQGGSVFDVGDSSSLTIDFKQANAGNDGGTVAINLTGSGALTLNLYANKSGDTTTVDYGLVSGEGTRGVFTLTGQGGTRTYNSLVLAADIGSTTSETTTLHTLTLASISNVTVNTLAYNIGGDFLNSGSTEALTATNDNIGLYSIVNENGTYKLYYVTGREEDSGKTLSLTEGAEATSLSSLDGYGDVLGRLNVTVTPTEDVPDDAAVLSVDKNFSLGTLAANGGALSVDVGAGNTLELGHAESGSGASIAFTGTGTLRKTGSGELTISDLSGFAGSLAMADDTSVTLDTGATLAGLTMGNNTTLTVSGEGHTVTIGTQAADLNTMGAGVVISSNGQTRTLKAEAGATLRDNRYLLLNGGTLNVGGGGTVEVFGISLSCYGSNATTVEIEAGATMHIFGTSHDTSAGNKAAFSLSHWNAANRLNVSGTLISDAAIVSIAQTTASLNVKDGGKLVMTNGLLGYRRDSGAKSVINIESGGTLSVGSAEDNSSAALTVNMAAGSTIEAYADNSIVGQTLTLGTGEGAVNFSAAAGKTLTIKSLTGDRGINIKGAGTVALEGMTLTNALSVEAGSTLSLKGNVTISKTIDSAGTVSLAEGGQLTLADVAGLETGGEATYSDAVSGSDQNGYLNASYIVVKGSGTVTGLNSVTLNGSAHTLTESGGNRVITFDGTGDYYVNTGTIVYGGTEENANSAASEATTGIVLNGGNLTLNTGLKDNAKTGGIVVQQAATVKINGGVTLAKEHLTAHAATRLDGSGGFELGGSFDLSDTGNTELSSGWTGTVFVEGVDFNGTAGNVNNAAKLDNLANANSWVGLSGCTGWLPSGGSIAANLRLQAGDAVTLTDGASSQTQTFSGRVAGEGNFVISMSDSIGVNNVTYVFSGDVSGWTGKFDSSASTTGRTFALQFTGEGNIGTSILNGLGRTLNVTIGGTGNRTMNGSITNTVTDTATGTLNLTVQGAGAKSFTNTVTASSINISGGAANFSGTVQTGALTVGAETTMSSLTLSGAATLNANLTVEGGTTLATTAASITIADGKYFSTNGGDLKVTGTANSTTITTSAADAEVTTSNEAITISNAAVTVNSATDYTLGAKLSGSTLTNTGAGTATVKVGEGSTNDFDASQGSVTIDAPTASVGDLTVGDGKTVTIGDGTGTATISGTATLANGSTVGGDVTIADSGTLVIGGNGFSADGFGAIVEGTLTANATAISMADADKIDVSGITTTTTYVLATAQNMAIAGNFDAANFYTGTLAEGMTATVSVQSMAGAIYAIDRATASQLVLTLTAADPDAPVTLTATAVGTSYTDGTLNIDVTGFDLDTLSGKDLAVSVDREAWESIVTEMSGVEGGVYNTATITLNGTTLDNFGTVSFNGYTGTGTTGEYFVAYIPEPATATLSLLALAALAARRRRK